MKATSVASLKARLSAFLEDTRSGPILVTRHGRPVAILVEAPEDPDELERFMVANNPRFRRISKRAEKSRLVPHDEFWRIMEERYGPYPTNRRRSRRR